MKVIYEVQVFSEASIECGVEPASILFSTRKKALVYAARKTQEIGGAFDMKAFRKALKKQKAEGLAFWYYPQYVSNTSSVRVEVSSTPLL